MSQMTFDDDDLFDEMAAEMREEIEASLADARGELPAADDVWEVNADNTLGVLNALRSALDAEDAVGALRDGKKQYAMGERADAFEDADDLADEIEELEELVADIEKAHEQVSGLAATLPELRGALEEADDEADEADD